MIKNIELFVKKEHGSYGFDPTPMLVIKIIQTDDKRGVTEEIEAEIEIRELLGAFT